MIDAKWLGRWISPYVLGAVIMAVLMLLDAGRFSGAPGWINGLALMIDVLIIVTLVEICVIITERRKEGE